MFMFISRSGSSRIGEGKVGDGEDGVDGLEKGGPTSEKADAGDCGTNGGVAGGADGKVRGVNCVVGPELSPSTAERSISIPLAAAAAAEATLSPEPPCKLIRNASHAS
jgi:hypothetical protein